MMMEQANRELASPLNRRRLMAGAAGIGAATLLGARLAGAQEDATPAEDDLTTDPRQEAEDAAAALYQNFLGKLALSLGVADAATLDLAIRDALKAIVDETFAAGEISANFATERKAAIDESVAPIGIGAAGFLRGSFGGGQGGRGGRGPRDGRGGPIRIDDGDEDIETDDEGA